MQNSSRRGSLQKGQSGGDGQQGSDSGKQLHYRRSSDMVVCGAVTLVSSSQCVPSESV